MKILTLFLALFLTFLPDGAPYVSVPQGQAVCMEEIDDVEEEAVIRVLPRIVITSFDSFFSVCAADPDPGNGRGFPFSSGADRLCFVRQWLICCRLRL